MRAAASSVGLPPIRWPERDCAVGQGLDDAYSPNNSQPQPTGVFAKRGLREGKFIRRPVPGEQQYPCQSKTAATSFTRSGVSRVLRARFLQIAHLKTSGVPIRFRTPPPYLRSKSPCPLLRSYATHSAIHPSVVLPANQAAFSQYPLQPGHISTTETPRSAHSLPSTFWKQNPR